MRIRFRFEDPDGDVVQLIFTWFLSGTQTTVREVNSPEDVDLTGLTSGVITGTFTNLTVLNPFAVRPNEVRIVAVDAQGVVEQYHHGQVLTFRLIISTKGVIAGSPGLAMRSELPWVKFGQSTLPQRGYCRPETLGNNTFSVEKQGNSDPG